MKNKLKKHGIIILILTIISYLVDIYLTYVIKKIISEGKFIENKKIIFIKDIRNIISFIIIIISIIFIIELFQACVLYCKKLAKQKELPETYKWFGLLLIIGIVILMFATSGKEQSGTNISTADELMKFNELYTQGIITKEELLEKKNQLLKK